MKKTTCVVILLLIAFPVFCSSLHESVQRIESAWALSYYQQNARQQPASYAKLLAQIKALSTKFPQSQELKIWQAVLLSTNAIYEAPLAALSSINKAKVLLEEAIKKQPHALQGSAFVTLGSLYYRVPGWPVSFGDTEIAEKLLKKAVAINPEGIDSNYFYADYLLTQGRNEEAKRYFKKASQAPLRKQQIFADEQLQKKAISALTNITVKGKQNQNLFLSFFLTSRHSAKE